MSTLDTLRDILFELFGSRTGLCQLDELECAEFLSAIEDRFDTRLPEGSVCDVCTLAQLAAVIEALERAYG